MKAVREYFPTVRLKKLMREPGGFPASEALARAERALESIREQCILGIEQKLAELDQIKADVGARHICYRLSNEVFVEAGTFGLDELSEAALSFCVFLDACEASGVPQDGVDVHINAMLALRRPSIAQDAAMKSVVLSELRALSQHFVDANRSASVDQPPVKQ
jgi:hypothetical protein